MQHRFETLPNKLGFCHPARRCLGGESGEQILGQLQGNRLHETSVIRSAMARNTRPGSYRHPFNGDGDREERRRTAKNGGGQPTRPSAKIKLNGLAAMEATVQLPEALAHQLEKLAEEEGTSIDGLIRRLVSEHLERRGSRPAHRTAPRKDALFPPIPKEETGVIRPVTGTDLDEIFALDDLAS